MSVVVMMLPEAVANYLMSLVADTMRPFTLCAGHDWQVKQWWGEPLDVGLDGLTVGADIRDVAPFLVGQDSHQHVVLPMVSTNGSNVFHVHSLPGKSELYVLFLPAEQEHSALVGVQQTANEVKLMNHRQRQLVDELSAAKAKLEDRERELTLANEVKARFIAGMSHEFRTPLTAILGYSELIDDHTSVDTDVAAHSQSVGRAARHLLSMVDNILDQARLDDGEVLLSPTSVTVRDLVDDLAAIMAPLAAARVLGFGAYVANDVPDAILTDVVRLRQVLLNLLGNAVKFTEEGEVRLEVTWQNDELQMAVIDSGPGIAKDEQRAIFDEFKRGRGSESVRGVGLGLNIARRLMDVLGGTIEVASELGEGSRFLVTLPTEPVALVPVRPTPSGDPIGPASGAGARILVVEDDPDIIDLVQIILGRAEYDVAIAMNGRDAVEQVLESQPDLVLMDVNMPEMTGMEAARIMRERGVHCPIIALSASLGVDDRDGAIKAGYDTYLVKPIAANDLLAAIDLHLQST
ncbi:MAG: response regulator [Gammaproteobacteria bacterium]